MSDKDKQNRIETEQDKVDSYIITACITLIAAFAIIISIKKPSDEYLSYSYLIALLALTISLLASLWHKFRFPKRQELYKKEFDKVLRKISGEIADFGENILIPLKQTKLIEAQAREKNMSLIELTKKVNEDNDKHAKNVIKTYLEKLNFESKEKSREIFKKPLNEKNSYIKHQIDRIAQGLRYFSFTVGLIFFFVSIFMTLLNK